MFSFSCKIFSFFSLLTLSALQFQAGAMPEDEADSASHTRTHYAQDYMDNVARNELGHALTGVLALTAAGDTIVSWNSGSLLMPASNMKLLTTGLALDALGSDFEYRTGIGYSGKICDSTLVGDLYITGGGDPTLASDDSIATALGELFRHWTGFLGKAGIRKIDGHIIGDDRYFGLPMPEEQTWQWDDCGTYYGAGVSGLTFFENMQTFSVAPGNEVGAPVSIQEKFPECPWMEYRYSCTTGEAGTGDRLYFYTTDMVPVGEMRGTFAVDRVPKTLECSNKFPAYTCAAYFTGWLSDRGIKCTEGPADTGFFAPAEGYVPQDSLTMLGWTASPSLGRIAFMTNHDSNNVYAETLYHTLGKELWGKSDYVSSRQVMRKLLQEKGLDPRGIVIQDGSGLSRHNLLSPSFICGFLKAMEKSPEFDTFLYGLPSPGEGGTMETVMTGYRTELKSRVRLKSGSMTGVKCFSGYVFPTSEAADAAGDITGTAAENSAATSGPAVFSIMINNSLMSQYRMQKIIDRLIFLITADMDSNPS